MDKITVKETLRQWSTHHLQELYKEHGYSAISPTQRCCDILKSGIVPELRVVRIIKDDKDEFDYVDKALHELSDKQKQAVFYEYMQRGKQKEKAKRLGISTDSFRNRLDRAYTNLQQLF